MAGLATKLFKLSLKFFLESTYSRSLTKWTYTDVQNYMFKTLIVQNY